MSVVEFLKGLPSYNEKNFTKFHVDSNNRTAQKRPAIYVPTKEFPPEQVIVTEKQSILLKYMQQHWDKKVVYNSKKRELADADDPSRKRPRVE